MDGFIVSFTHLLCNTNFLYINLILLTLNALGILRWIHHSHLTSPSTSRALLLSPACKILSQQSKVSRNSEKDLKSRRVKARDNNKSLAIPGIRNKKLISKTTRIEFISVS